MVRNDTIQWETLDHEHKNDKGQDWYWALGLIVVSIAIAAILLGNTLFALLVILAAVALGLSVNQKQELNKYTVNTRGISVNKLLYPYKNLEAFWIDETRPNENILIVDIQKPLMPHLIIRIPASISTNDLQDYLLDYLPEEEIYESPAQRLAEMFGF
jgi:hypothetical protein